MGDNFQLTIHYRTHRTPAAARELITCCGVRKSTRTGYVASVSRPRWERNGYLTKPNNNGIYSYKNSSRKNTYEASFNGALQAI